MKQLLLYILFVLAVFTKLPAQVNIVPNAGFESYHHCPNQPQEIFTTILDSGWFSAKVSPDYFNNCATVWERQVPDNRFGTQNAHIGHAYIGLGMDYTAHSIPPSPFPNYYYNQLREIPAVKLKYKLTKDSIYTVGFYVSLADNHAFSIRNWGCMFSKDSIYTNAQGSIDLAHQVNEKFISDTSLLKVDLFPDSALKNVNGWTKVEATFKAKGGEQYMYIGSFIQPYDIVWEESPNFANIDTATCQCQGAYYYIDDLYLYGDTNYKAVSVVENLAEQIRVYPNPATNILSVNTGNLKNIQIALFDISGRKLSQQKLYSSTENIDISGLSNGIYICTITSNNQVVKREKVIISR